MLTKSKIYQICNKYDWCTHATNMTYEKILKMSEQGFETREIAWSIYLVTDPKFSFDFILKELKSLSRKR